MKLLALICSAMFIVAYAQAQTSTTSSTTTSQPTTSSNTSNATTTSSTNSGTVTDYTPGTAITLDPGTGKPVQFIIGKKVQVRGPDGKLLAETDVKKNARVRVRLVQEGDRTVVERINLEDAQ